MSINDSCPCYPYYSGLPRAPVGIFTPLPLGDGCLVNPGEIDPDTGCVMAEVQIVLPLLNPGFELNSGDKSVPTSWTVYRARVQVGDVHGGLYKLAAEQVSSANATSYSVDLIAAGILAESIDTGARTATINYWFSSNEDYGSIGFKFWSSSGILLKHDQKTWDQDTNATWVSKTYSSQVPAGTRFIQIYIDFYRKTGDGIGAYFDDLELYFNDWRLDCSGASCFQLPIINPGADLGDTTGWTGQIEVRSLSSTPHPHTGAHYFYGGEDVASSSATQAIEIDPGIIAVSGKIAKLSWWQSTYTAQNDKGTVEAIFYNSSDVVVASILPPLITVTPEIWTKREYSSGIPDSAVTVEIRQIGTRVDGVNCDNFIDDIELSFNCDALADEDIPIINPGAESGDMTGWNSGTGQYDSATTIGGGTQLPHTGDRFFADQTGGLSIGEYEFNSNSISLESKGDLIDLGAETITLDYWQASFAANNDPGAAGIRFYSDVAGTTLISESFNAYYNGTALAWENRVDVYSIPANTRSIRIVGKCDLVTTTYASASFDDFKLTYHYG